MTALELPKPVDQYTEINDNTIRHAVSFIFHLRYGEMVDSMPGIILIVKGHCQRLRAGEKEPSLRTDQHTGMGYRGNGDVGIRTRDLQPGRIAY